MSDITQVYDTYLVSKVIIKRWEDEFLAEWYKLPIKMMMSASEKTARNYLAANGQGMNKGIPEESLGKFRGM